MANSKIPEIFGRSGAYRGQPTAPWRGHASPLQSRQSVPVPSEPELSSVESDRRALEAALRPFLDDVRSTLDPAFELVVTFDDGLWLFSACGGGASFPESPGEWDRAELTAAVARAIPDSPAFDSFLEPWPLCPEHRDHPLYPEVRVGAAVWACRNGAPVRIPIGHLPGTAA